MDQTHTKSANSMYTCLQVVEKIFLSAAMTHYIAKHIRHSIRDACPLHTTLISSNSGSYNSLWIQRDGLWLGDQDVPDSLV